MGLRLAEGVDLARLARLGGRAVEALVDLGEVARLGPMVQRDGDRLRVLPAGMLLLDAILPAIVRAGEE